MSVIQAYEDAIAALASLNIDNEVTTWYATAANARYHQTNRGSIRAHLDPDCRALGNSTGFVPLTDVRQGRIRPCNLCSSHILTPETAQSLRVLENALQDAVETTTAPGNLLFLSRTGQRGYLGGEVFVYHLSQRCFGLRNWLGGFFWTFAYPRVDIENGRGRCCLQCAQGRFDDQ